MIPTNLECVGSSANCCGVGHVHDKESLLLPQTCVVLSIRSATYRLIHRLAASLVGGIGMCSHNYILSTYLIIKLTSPNNTPPTTSLLSLLRLSLTRLTIMVTTSRQLLNLIPLLHPAHPLFLGALAQNERRRGQQTPQCVFH